MRVLFAEDEPAVRRFMEESLQRLGCDVHSVADGSEAWRALEQPDAPSLAILDWMMPGIDGLELCRRVRSRADGRYVYIILLTGRAELQDRVDGLEAGADDFMSKPCDVAELGARVRAGERILSLEGRLDARIHELESSLVRVKPPHGPIPICIHCKSPRADQNTWQRVESGSPDQAHVAAERPTQWLCNRCLELHYPDDAEPGPPRPLLPVPLARSANRLNAPELFADHSLHGPSRKRRFVSRS